MFQIKSEEIEVTPKMVEKGRIAFVGNYSPTEYELARIYRAMEQARRDAQIGIVWGEPNANAAKATLPPIWLIELSFPKGYTEYRETSLGCAVERARAGLEDGASTVLIKLSR